MAEKAASPMAEKAEASMSEKLESLSSEKVEPPMEDPPQDPPEPEEITSDFMYGFVLLDPAELFTQIRVEDGYLECILPDFEFEPLGEKQCEKLDNTPSGAPVIVLGNGYPGWLYTLIGACKTRNTYLYQGPKNKRDVMLIKKLRLCSKVFNLKCKIGPSTYRLYAQTLAGSDIKPDGWEFTADVKMMPNHMITFIEDALDARGESVGPNVTIKLVGKNNELIPLKTPIWDPRLVSRPLPRQRVLMKQSVQKMHLKKLVDFR